MIKKQNLINKINNISKQIIELRINLRDDYIGKYHTLENNRIPNCSNEEYCIALAEMRKDERWKEIKKLKNNKFNLEKQLIKYL